MIKVIPTAPAPKIIAVIVISPYNSFQGQMISNEGYWKSFTFRVIQWALASSK